jgi:predicted phage terminase large subunit-like protein
MQQQVTPEQAAQIVLTRRRARTHLLDYIKLTKPDYKVSLFSQMVCCALDKFIVDVNAGKRPILLFQAPPQHGKSEIVSRKLPAYLMARFPNWRIGALSYAEELVVKMATDVRSGLRSKKHQSLLKLRKPSDDGTTVEWQKLDQEKDKYKRNTSTDFHNVNGTGSYICAGMNGGFTGNPVDIGIIDDPTKNQQEALSETTKESHWNAYQSVFTTRMSENSGQIIMATSWAEDDLPGRVLTAFKGDPRLIHLAFPAINDPNEIGYNPALPEGPLVPELHSLTQLHEIKKLLSAYWWSAIYQQSPKVMGGNVFEDKFVQYYRPNDLPRKYDRLSFDKVVSSWDCTFKDTDGTDFVSGQVWGKKGARAYLLAHYYGRMSFTATLKAIIQSKKDWPMTSEVLIEDKANGPAVIDVLRKSIPGIIPIEPDGSKLARAYAVTSYWEASNVFLPHPADAAWITHYVHELTRFPAAAHDDQVDSFTQAIRRLFPLYGTMNISDEVLKAVLGQM